jgi:hypothetical protein
VRQQLSLLCEDFLEFGVSGWNNGLRSWYHQDGDTPLKPALAFILAMILAFGSALRAAPAETEQQPPVRFGRDILPILSENCFRCHGPDDKARKAKLRLDTREGALKVVLPGNSAASELIRRINANTEEDGMPPAKSNRHLTAQQKKLLANWIDQGARWEKHWAYETPVRPPVPDVQNKAWLRNAIDNFVLARLEKEGLAPSAEAAKETLIRRVTLDLIGLPPTTDEVARFVADNSPNAYERVVDRLFASPHYGERMAMEWLDQARFADTNGYQNDFARTMWPWRDWVIAAFNHNLPYDRFITEQIAGDLVPGATLDQRIASGFNRNNRTVTEGGSIDEEWRVENVVDRVETTSTVFLGLTMGCARCHDHKYDPILQKEFYQFFAFFNSVNEKGVYTEQPGNVAPLVALPSKEDEKHLKRLDRALADARNAVHQAEAALPAEYEKWQSKQASKRLTTPYDWAIRFPLSGTLSFAGSETDPAEASYRGPGRPNWVDSPLGKAVRLDGKENSFVDAGNTIHLERLDSFSYGGWVKPAGPRGGTILSKMDDAADFRGFDLLLNNGKTSVHLVHSWPANAIKIETKDPVPPNGWSHLFVTYDGSSKAAGLKVYVNGSTAEFNVLEDHLQDTIATLQPLRLGKRSTSFAFRGDLADIRVYHRALASSEVESLSLQPWQRILQTPPQQRTKAQQDSLIDLFRTHYASDWLRAQARAAKAREERAAYDKRLLTVMVMEDLATPRDTYVLQRGRYDSPDKKQKVQPNVPACLPHLPGNVPANRLGLARWLTDPTNPLTARVAVNRFWQRYFGTGLVKTTENFGLQSEPPSHPELLDWLATEFIRTGWNVAALQRLIVTSATYRQSSRETPALLRRDPDNRLLARGPRFRLAAEMVRDNALAVSGLLVEKIGGRSVKPYQPAGLWEDLAGGAGEGPYVQDKGPNLYRRSLYIYRKRTVPHPSMATFDAPSREICQVNRARTNTPLQALELLNDVTYVEAARHLGQLMLTDGGPCAEERISLAFRRATSRAPRPTELNVLLAGLGRYLDEFRRDPEAARSFVQHGDSPVDPKLDAAELAAYTATASVILNLDETITKE